MNPSRSTRRSVENLAGRTPSGWNVNRDEPNLLGRYDQKREKQRGHRRPHQGFIDRPKPQLVAPNYIDWRTCPT